MNPDEVEFLAEKQVISIIPTFNSSFIHLISGDVGPFRASLPINVPLWVAINLKQQRKCRIQPPDWMNVETLEQLREDEKLSSTFIKMPSEHYMIEAKVLLNYVDDIPKSDEIRTIIKDIWDTRISKMRSSIDTLVKNAGMFAGIDNLTLLEINSMRPLLPNALDQIYQIKKARGPRLQTQNTTLSLLNTSHTSASTN